MIKKENKKFRKMFIVVDLASLNEINKTMEWYNHGKTWRLNHCFQQFSLLLNLTLTKLNNTQIGVINLSSQHLYL